MHTRLLGKLVPMHHIEIGSGPHEENLAQVRPDGFYIEQMGNELAAWKSQLERLYPPPEGCSFVIRWSPHEFGSYGEVVAQATPDNADWAYGCEVGAATWDAEARKELGMPEVAHG